MSCDTRVEDLFATNVISHFAYSNPRYPALTHKANCAYHGRYLSLAGMLMTTDTTVPAISSQNERLKIFVHALLFVAGFSLVFIVAWGGSVTLVGQFFGAYKRIIA